MTVKGGYITNNKAGATGGAVGRICAMLLQCIKLLLCSVFMRQCEEIDREEGPFESEYDAWK